jgi:superfamily I DNA and/or RNA helicase
MCFHYLVVLPAFTTEILSIVIQSLNYINPTYETGKQFVRIKSVANLLNAFQQLTICYIAYNLARRTSYLLQVE